MKLRETFSSKLGFFLSAIGFSIGIGSLWRFPYLVGQYGGGVFLLFYLLSVFFIAIPLFTLELALGSASGKAPVGAYKKLGGGGWVGNGFLNVFALQLLLGFTMPVAGWIMAYIFKTGVGTFNHMTPNEIGNYFDSFIGSFPEVCGWMLITIVLNHIIITRGLNKGLERANVWCMPLLFILLIILVIRSVTLPGAKEGLAFYLMPDFSKFTWTAVYEAVGQSFFAIGVGISAAIVFGSYLKHDHKDIVRQGLYIGLSCTLAGILAGFMIFPAVFSYGLEPSSGPGLTFITMQNVFNQMPFGLLFGVVFYALFYLAALSSWLGASEAAVANYMEIFGLSRKKAVMLMTLLTSLLAAASAWSMQFFDIANNLLNASLVIGGLVLALFVAYRWKLHSFFKEAFVQSELAKKYWYLVVMVIAPVTIIALGLNLLGIL